jgi:hypothetical protein
MSRAWAAICGKAGLPDPLAPVMRADFQQLKAWELKTMQRLEIVFFFIFYNFYLFFPQVEA